MGDPDDWKSVKVGSSDWNSIEENIFRAYEQLRGTLQEIDEEKMDEEVKGTIFTYSWMLFGLVHHSLYHAGQIAIMTSRTHYHDV